MKIGFIVFAQNNYITFFEQYYKSFKRNFLPSIDKKFIVIVNESDSENIEKYISSFTNDDCLIVPLDKWTNNLSYFIKKSYTVSILCDDSYIKDFDYLLISNINFNCSKRIEHLEQVYDDTKLLTLTQSNFLDNSKFDYETNTESVCYINPKHGKHYVRGGFVFGKTNNVKTLYSNIYNLLDMDLKNGILPKWDDESALNRLVLGNESLYKILPIDATFQISKNLDDEKFKDVFFTIIEKRWFFKKYNFDAFSEFNYPKPCDEMLLTVYGLFKLYGNEGHFFARDDDDMFKVFKTDKGSIVLKKSDYKMSELHYNSNYKIWY